MLSIPTFRTIQDSTRIVGSTLPPKTFNSIVPHIRAITPLPSAMQSLGLKCSHLSSGLPTRLPTSH
ncbi:hypothetical protein B0H19DRAFT_1137970 [Mycena capillaripes]|nr:hypothetical protein B0H19DRAFT_1137970 [Mycena capillaripes]